MKAILKKNVWVILAFILFLICFEWFSKPSSFVVAMSAFVFTLLGIVIQQHVWRYIMMNVAIFLGLIAVAMSHSLLFAIVLFIIFVCVIRVNRRDDFVIFGESLLQPLDTSQMYHGIKVVQSQSAINRSLEKKPLSEVVGRQEGTLMASDINLVYFGGNSIIDFGNTMLPQGESVIMIRKLFGKTRLIIPKEFGLYINVSAIDGDVIFEQETYHLIGENFLWESPDYAHANRRVKLIYSVAHGKLEVILL